MSKTALVVTASVQTPEQSVSRQLANELINHLQSQDKITKVIHRDLSSNESELITAAHVGAFYTPPADRSDDQKSLLSQSDTYLEEVKQADYLVIATPMYNFSVPAVLKAWIDLICRVGETFKYTEKGPVGLSGIETAYLVVATGGAPVGSAVDFVVPYLTQIANFIGVKEVKVIAADKLNAQRDQALEEARAAIAKL